MSVNFSASQSRYARSHQAPPPRKQPRKHFQVGAPLKNRQVEQKPVDADSLILFLGILQNVANSQK